MSAKTLDKLHEKCNNEGGCTGGGCVRQSGKTARKRENMPNREQGKFARRKEQGR